MNQQPTVTIKRTSPRYGEWVRTLGTDTVAVTSVLPIRADAPGAVNQEFYRLDVRTLTDAQTRALVKWLSDRFNLDVNQVGRMMFDPEHGVPILAADVVAPVIESRMVD